MLKQNIRLIFGISILYSFTFACKSKVFMDYDANKDPNVIELNKLPKDSLTTIKFNIDTLKITSANNSEMLEDSFHIINTGAKLLKIASYTTSCECTSIKLKNFIAKPNERIGVKVFIDKEKLTKGENSRAIFFTGNFEGIYKQMYLSINLK